MANAAEPVGRRETGRGMDMAIAFAAQRQARFAVALLAFAMVATARAEDVPPPQQQPGAAAPSGQKSGGPGGRGAAPASPAAAEQHRLPPDSTTNQTLALPGRTLAFAATAG